MYGSVGALGAWEEYEVIRGMGVVRRHGSIGIMGYGGVGVCNVWKVM